MIRTPWTSPLHRTLIDISVDNDLTMPIDIDMASFGMLYLPATFNGTSVSFLVSDAEDGAYVPLNNAAGTPVSLTVVDATAGAVALPSDLFGARWMKIQTGSVQTVTDTQLIVTLKG